MRDNEEQREARAIAATAMADRSKAVDVIKALSDLKTSAAILWIGGLAELTLEAKDAAIAALEDNGSKDAARRLSWLAFDHPHESDRILSALQNFDAEIAGEFIASIEHRQFERAVTDLHKAIDHKDEFNRHSRHNAERFDRRITGIALKITAPDQFEKHLNNKNELPDLRAALTRAVQSIPLLKEEAQVQAALGQLSLKL